MNSLLKEIENDKVGFAYSKILEKRKDSIIGFDAYLGIVSLNKLVSSSLRSKTPCSSSCFDIYRLAELCSSIEGMWGHNQPVCMQCTYHIMRYLLNQKEPLLARKLCYYFFLRCKKEDNKTWSEKEYLILQSTVTHFCYYLYDMNKELMSDDSESDSNPFVSWFKFILRLNEFSEFRNTNDCFQLFYSLIRRSKSSSTRTSHSDIVRDLMEEFSHHLRKLVEEKHIWNPKIDVIVFSVNIISDILFYYEKEKCNLQVLVYQSVRDFIKSMKTIICSYPISGASSCDIDLIEHIFIMFFSEKDKELASDFGKFYEAIQRKDICIEVYPLIFTSLLVLRSKISKSLSASNARVVDLVKIIYGMFVKFREKLKEFSTGKGSSLLDAFIAAMYFLHTAKLGADSLKELFKTVRLFFHEFNYLVINQPKGQAVFECGVSYCINIIQSYKDVELYKEMASLSKSLIKYILKLDPKFMPVDRFKVKLEHLLNNFVTSYGKIGLLFDAQVGLLAFAGVHSQFTDVIFKYWAELKANFTDLNQQKDTTCYDIINKSKKEMEDNWPPCLVDSINIGKCLLEEIKAYAKHRDLQIGSVIAVYRIAVKLIKDKLILSQILSAVVDSVSSDEYVPTLNNLQLSLENILGSLFRLKENTKDEQTLCQINSFIGDNLYQQVRCEINHLRKKAAYELELMDVPAKEDVPVVDGEDNNFTPAYSYLKLNVQHSMTEKMSRVLDFWSKAASYITAENKHYFSLRYIKGLAYIFRLYEDKTLEVETWKLVFDISRKFNIAKYKVLAVSELLGLTHQVDSKWIKDVKETILSDGYLKKTYVHTLFFINLAKNFYLNKDFNEAQKQANEIDIEALKKYYLLNAQHKILNFFIKVQLIEQPTDRSETVLLPVIKSFENLLYFIKMKTWRSFSEKCVVQWLLLEISLIVGKIYLDLRMIRHARCYAKKQLVVAQRLALPIRVCEFLTILSFADLITGNSIEADEKLNGLDIILGLDQISLPDRDSDLEFGVFGKTSSVSDINSPEFLSHKKDCCCLFCTSTLLLSIILNAFTLKMIYTSSGGVKDLTRHIAKIAKEIITFTNQKENSALQSLLDYCTESKVRFYVNLSLAHAIWGELEEALIWNRQAFDTQKSNGSCLLLVKEIQSQFTLLNWYFYKPSPTIKYVPKLYSEDKLPIENARTPEPIKPVKIITKHLKKAVSPNTYSKIPISPRPSIARKVIFDDFEKDLDFEGKYLRNDKENLGSPKTNPSYKNILETSPLAQAIPESPKLVLRENAFLEEGGNINQVTPRSKLEWDVETPMPNKKSEKTPVVRTRTRRAHTEKKTVKKLFSSDVLSTPFTTSKKPGIKVFCDDDHAKMIMNSANNLGKKKGAAGKSTVKKAPPKTIKKTAPISLTGRKLTFDSDSDGECHLNKGKGNKQKPLGRQLFEDGGSGGEATAVTTTSWASDESGIIEPSFIEQDSLSLALTPLEDSMKKLTLSGKKLIPLSTKRMAKVTKLQYLDQTPTSSTLSKRSSRLNGQSVKD